MSEKPSQFINNSNRLEVITVEDIENKKESQTLMSDIRESQKVKLQR
jgi:hypothetical protein